MAACGGDGDSGGSSGGTAEGALADADLSGVSITVGSKDFDEQKVLGNILADAYEAAGAKVDRKIDLGGTNVVRKALLSGDIDSYAEYNGTGWAEHLKQEDPSDNGEELTEKVRKMDLEENDIVWVGRAPFNNTYGFVTGPDLTKKNGGPFTFDSMAKYLKENPDAKVCMEAEFPSRSDGLVLWEEATGYKIPKSQQEILDTGLIYTETKDGNCDFGESYTTDGRISGLGLTLVEDPGVMIIYNISINVRKDVYEEAPEAFDTIAEAVLAPLDQKTMTALNNSVSTEGEDPADVAEQYLVDQGLIKGSPLGLSAPPTSRESSAGWVKASTVFSSSSQRTQTISWRR
ncbi:glycine betaine ABC transporter substrate-binding protein [Candidatus Neomicrothrix sp.]|uniref:glycine betaine ABC transporter substrate-binding protein n=3 Tax=Candidatus Neomicrothrix TaxID=41949 RepID=UPI0025B86F3F|nr:glycine betaine ABC transporter substrate-binding protein [Candidatus Microthrix sp.]